MAAVLPVALVLAGLALHEHEADARVAGYADCDGCHLSCVVTEGGPPFAPGLVAHAVGYPASDGERVWRSISISVRGPPA